MTRFRLFVLFAVAAVAVLVLHSCLKEEPPGGFEPNGVNNALTMKEAQRLFESAVLDTPETRSGSRSTLLPPVFAPDWDAAVFRTLEYGSSVTVPLHTSHRAYAKRDSLPGRPPGESYFVRVSQALVIVKNAEHGTSSVYIQHVVPDKGYYNRHKNDRYFDVWDDDFSGFEFMCRLSGRVVYLHTYTGGRLDGQLCFNWHTTPEKMAYRMMALRRRLGRTVLLVTPTGTKAGDDDIAWEMDVPGVIVSASACDCPVHERHAECVYPDCQCKVDELGDACPSCEKTPACSECSTCGQYKCLCSCDGYTGGDLGDGGTSGSGGDGGSGDTGGNSGDTGGNTDGDKDKTKTAKNADYIKGPVVIDWGFIEDRLEDIIDGPCMGQGLHRMLGSYGIPVNIEITNDVMSDYNHVTDEIRLSSGASACELAHEMFHALQRRIYINRPIPDAANYQNSDLNQEAEAFMMMTRFLDNQPANRRPAKIQGIDYDEWRDSDVAEACENVNRLLDSTGELIDESADGEAEFQRMFKKLCDAIQESGISYSNGKYNEFFTVDDNLKTLREIYKDC